MKKGFAVVGIIIGIVAVALIGLGAWVVIDGNNKAVKFDDYDFHSIIEPTKDNGNIGDHIKGDPKAPVIVFEYADYQCPGCASVNSRVNKMVEELDGQVAVVYRSFLLPYHQNGTAAASAAEAAGLQGYWKEYADKLFMEQSEWEYASPSKRTEYFDKYFEEVTEGKGDLEKFKKDLASEEVSKKISFDMGVAKRVNVSATPAFYVDGQFIDWGDTDQNGTGSVVINGETISWEGTLSGDSFIQVFRDIVKAKSR